MSLLKELFQIIESQKSPIKLRGPKDIKKIHFKDRPYFDDPKEPITHGGNVVINQTKSGELAGTMAAEGQSSISPVNEAKKLTLPRAPRHKQLNDVLRSKKGGAHHDDKSDYRRSKEKQKFHKQMMAEDGVQEASITGITTASGQGRKHDIEMSLSPDELEALVGVMNKTSDQRLEKIKQHLAQLHARAGKHVK